VKLQLNLVDALVVSYSKILGKLINFPPGIFECRFIALRRKMSTCSDGRAHILGQLGMVELSGTLGGLPNLGRRVVEASLYCA
jgi:hypothetical protein